LIITQIEYLRQCDVIRMGLIRMSRGLKVTMEELSIEIQG